jgi:TRAP-type C4-dicarboxylate transport system permease large subunit
VPLEAVMIQVSSGVNSFSLLAIPFFVLAGAILAEGGMAVRLVNLARIFVGAVRGGLALVNVIASTFFSGVSGSSVADSASIGSVLIPQMVKQGYPKVFTTNVTICGSVQAVLIPPSHNAVLYSLAAGGTISVAQLFMAGVLPGLLFGACVMGLCLILSYRRGYPKGEPVTLRQAGKIAVDALWGLVTVFIILGGILSGVFTPTESAAVACLHAFGVTMFIYRNYRWALIGFSAAFGYMMALMQVPAKAIFFFVSVAANKYQLLLMINILLIALGTFMDMAPMILICTPILLPVVQKFGIDPVHFGMILLVNSGIGLITPPVGPTLFIGCAIGKVKMEEVSRELWPFYAAMCAALMIVTYVPELSLWLPHLLAR